MADYDVQRRDNDLEILQSGIGKTDEHLRKAQAACLDNISMHVLVTDFLTLQQLWEPEIIIEPVCNVFMDVKAPDEILEKSAQLIYYLLGIKRGYHSELLETPGVIESVCSRLENAHMSNTVNKNMAEQCIKVLHSVCRLIHWPHRKITIQWLSVVRFLIKHHNALSNDTIQSALYIACWFARLEQRIKRIQKSTVMLDTCVEPYVGLLNLPSPVIFSKAVECIHHLLTLNSLPRGTEWLAESQLVPQLLRHLQALMSSFHDNSENVNLANTYGCEEQRLQIAQYILESFIFAINMSKHAVFHLIHFRFVDVLDKAVALLAAGNKSRCFVTIVNLANRLLHPLIVTRMPAELMSFHFYEQFPPRAAEELYSGKIIPAIKEDNFSYIQGVLQKGFDVNWEDSNGQTLLNWAAAVGSPEMVKCLLQHDADINKGSKKSSLHYAVLFGCVENVEVLLWQGARVDLVDDAGLTALELAEQNTGETFQKIANSLRDAKRVQDGMPSSSTSNEDNVQDRVPINEAPETTSVFIEKCLSILISCDLPAIFDDNIRQGILTLLYNIVCHSDSSLLKKMCQTPDVVPRLTRIFSEEMEKEMSSQVYCSILHLLDKAPGIFLEQFRFLLTKVADWASPEEKTPLAEELTKFLREPTSIEEGVLYRWGRWLLILGKHGLFVWSTTIGLEFPLQKKSSFAFVEGLCDKCSIRRASEDGLTSKESSEEMQKLKKRLFETKVFNLENPPEQYLFVGPSASSIQVGCWWLHSPDSETCVIKPEDATHMVYLHSCGNNIVVEQCGGEAEREGFRVRDASFKVNFLHQLGFTFTPRESEVDENNKEQQLSRLARILFNYLSGAESTRHRQSTSQLKTVAQQLDSALRMQANQQQQSEAEAGKIWLDQMRDALRKLVCLLREEPSRCREFYSSGIVQTLLSLLNYAGDFTSCEKTKAMCRIDIFKEVFQESKGRAPAAELTNKLVTVLEAVEKLPVISYSQSHQQHDITLLIQKISMRIEIVDDCCLLTFRCSNGLEADPMTTVQQIDESIADRTETGENLQCGRQNMRWIQQMLSSAEDTSFSYTEDFDNNGVIYWLSTNGKTEEWVNPVTSGLLMIGTKNEYFLPMAMFFSHQNEQWKFDENSSALYQKQVVFIDLLLYIIPTHYTLQVSQEHRDCRWRLKGSFNEVNWLRLTGSADSVAEEPSDKPYKTFPLQWKGDRRGMRYIQLIVTRGTCLPFSNFEIYGHVGHVCFGIASTPGSIHQQNEEEKDKVMEVMETDSSVILHKAPHTGVNDVDFCSTSEEYWYDELPASTLDVAEPCYSAAAEERRRLHTNWVEENCDNNPGIDDFSWDAVYFREIGHKENGGDGSTDPHIPVDIVLSADYRDVLPEPSDMDAWIERRILPDPDSEQEPVHPRLVLTLRCTSSTENMEPLEVRLENRRLPIFHYIHQLVLQAATKNSCSDLNQQFQDLRWTLRCRKPDHVVQTEQPQNMTKDWKEVVDIHDTTRDGCKVSDLLELLRTLHKIADDKPPMATLSASEESKAIRLHIPQTTFQSQKLAQKLLKQMGEPLLLCGEAFPDWFDLLVKEFQMLIPQETRARIFNASSFGLARSLVWVTRENQTDREMQRHFHHLARVRETMPRDEQRLLEMAIEIMRCHGKSKAILEIYFEDEAGIGLGPIREFYSLLAAVLQWRSLGLWMCDDIHEEDDSEIDVGEGAKPAGTYVQWEGGLFPAPYPQDSDRMERVVELFHFLGTVLARCLMDNYRIDLPLSNAFFKLLVHIPQREVPRCFWFQGILSEVDFNSINPSVDRFLSQLRDLVARKQRILQDEQITEEEKHEALTNMLMATSDASIGPYRLDDLDLSFEYCPTSTVYGFQSTELLENGANKTLNLSNAEEYMDSVLSFALLTGISRQMVAFKEGFELVFPLEKLQMFSPEELQGMLCGEQAPNWTLEHIFKYVEPKSGFTHESPTYIMAAQVLSQLTAGECKLFLLFCTGCSSLPPGGLANLHPRMAIAHKVGEVDTYPSASTCVHFLKLPEYSSIEVLRERLLTAIRIKGFDFS